MYLLLWMDRHAILTCLKAMPHGVQSICRKCFPECAVRAMCIAAGQVCAAIVAKMPRAAAVTLATLQLPKTVTVQFI